MSFSKIIDAQTKIGISSRGFSKIKLPLLKGFYPKLIAKELVSVQPMQRPVGQYFYNKSTKTIKWYDFIPDAIEQVEEEFFKKEEFNL